MSGEGAVDLVPALDVEAKVERFIASGSSPWLRLEIDASRAAGRWVRVIYSSGLLEPLVRPVLRVFVGEARFDQILPAAILGRAIWIGRIPEGAREIWISPTNRPGAFAFRIERWQTISFTRLVGMISAAHPWRGCKFLWASSTGHARFAALQARRALGPTPLEKYHTWRRPRARRFEPEGFDAAPAGSAPAPHFRVIVRGSSPEIERWRRQLRSQPYPDWSLLRVGAEPSSEPATWVHSDAPFGDLHAGLERGDFLLWFRPGDILTDYALAALAQAARQAPEVDVFYGDEDRVDARGRHRDPALKPDWSPIFQSAASYLGAPVAVKVDFTARAMSSNGTASDRPTIDASTRVEHVRRMLLTRPLASIAAAPRGDDLETEPPPLGADFRACLIIPTRDRRDLLEKCVTSLGRHPAGAPFELIIIDNGSGEPSALAYLDALTVRSDCRVLRSPGPFNFSRLCNLAARETSAPFLVFLNNDMEVASTGWLSRLLALAARPEVGAAGAKLLHDDRTVQHAGIVLGVDDKAAHVQRGLAGDDPGYLDTLAAPREVAAVTGACLAVSSAKFAAVGGFDEVNLPIESNDVDLCLRLAERGWKSVIEPRALLFHHESASRGANKLLDERYASQIAYFRARWAEALRDDRYFHPALSLDALDLGLG